MAVSRDAVLHRGRTDGYGQARCQEMRILGGASSTESAHDSDRFHMTGWFDFRMPDTFDRHAELVTYRGHAIELTEIHA